MLSEYALLADGERGIMVGPRGDFVWMCAPRWDSDAMFSALIGEAGVYAVTGDPHTAVALRRILAIDGDTQVRVFLEARAGFGHHRPSRHGRCGDHEPARARRGGGQLRLPVCLTPCCSNRPSGWRIPFSP